MNVERLVVSPFQSNCYVIWERKLALVIDPGDDADDILAVLEKHSLDVAAYLLTHGHVDHIAATAALSEVRPAPAALHEADQAWAFSGQSKIIPFVDDPPRPADMSHPLEPDATYTDGGMSYRVLGTPGHSPGSVCFYFEAASALFTGDTLFAGSVGRTDFPGGDSRTLQASLKRLAALPDDTAVYAGHGPSTTIADEKRTNMFMVQAWR